MLLINAFPRQNESWYSAAPNVSPKTYLPDELRTEKLRIGQRLPRSEAPTKRADACSMTVNGLADPSSESRRTVRRGRPASTEEGGLLRVPVSWSIPCTQRFVQEKKHTTHS